MATVGSDSDVSTGGGVDALNMDEGDGTHDAEDAEFAACWTDMDDEGAVLSGWMRTFTSHYSAKRILEHHCLKNAKTDAVEITLLSVGSEYRNVSWEAIKSSIAATLDAMPQHERPSIPTDTIISIFETKIKDAKPTDKHAQGVVWALKDIIDNGHHRSHCRVPCEIALASLSIYGDVFAATEADKQVLKDLPEVVSNVNSLMSMLMFYAEIESELFNLVTTLLSYLLDIFTTS